MYEAFTKSDIAYKIKEGEEPKNDTVTMLQSNEISEDDLPVKDAFFKLDTKEIKDYIHQLEKKQIQNARITGNSHISYGIKLKKHKNL
ncbi:hypothetical protein [Methanolapillus millepedarum]